MSNKAKKQKKTVVINTKSWGRDEYVSPHGKCCAIGFAYKQLVDPSEQHIHDIGSDIDNHENLCDLYHVILEPEDCKSKQEQKYLGVDVVTANDEIQDTKLRRTILKRLFKKAGFRLLFK